MRAVHWERGETYHWLERYDEFLLGLSGARLGNGKCWFILKLFASLCIQLQSGLDVYHYPGWLQELMTVTRFKIKRSGYSAATLLLLLVLMNKNLMSFKLHNGHLKM